MRRQMLQAASWVGLIVVAVAGLSTQCGTEPAAVVPAQHGPVCPAQTKTR